MHEPKHTEHTGACAEALRSTSITMHQAAVLGLGSGAFPSNLPAERLSNTCKGGGAGRGWNTALE